MAHTTPVPDHAIAPPAKTGIQSDASPVDRLLDTAAALFWQKGYHATTTREIAAALQIQQASLYYHIASKEDLLYQLCLSALQQMLTAIPEALQGVDPPLARIGVLVRTHVAALLGHQKRNAVMLWELRALSPRHRSEITQLRKQYADLVRLVLQDAQDQGAIRTDILATHLSLALLNMLNWSVVWFHEDQELKPEQLAELFVKIFLDGAASPDALARGGIRRGLELTGEQWKPLKPAARGRKALRKSSREPGRAPETAATETTGMERVLKAAVALFSRKGYAATSTREVASLLGMQKASLYHHIQSKEDLLDLICKSSLEEIRGDVEAAIREVRDPLERVHVLVCAHLASMLQNQEEHSAAVTEMRSLSPERLAQVRALRHAYEDVVRGVLMEGQRVGDVRPDIDAKVLCLSMLGLLNRVLVWYRPRGPLSVAQLGQLLAVVFLTGAGAQRE